MKVFNQTFPGFRTIKGEAGLFSLRYSWLCFEATDGWNGTPGCWGTVPVLWRLNEGFFCCRQSLREGYRHYSVAGLNPLLSLTFASSDRGRAAACVFFNCYKCNNRQLHVLGENTLAWANDRDAKRIAGYVRVSVSLVTSRPSTDTAHELESASAIPAQSSCLLYLKYCIIHHKDCIILACAIYRQGWTPNSETWCDDKQKK